MAEIVWAISTGPQDKAFEDSQPTGHLDWVAAKCSHGYLLEVMHSCAWCTQSSWARFLGAHLSGALLAPPFFTPRMEVSPVQTLGMAVCMISVGSQVAWAFASALMALLNSWLGPELMLTWGWRVPFILSAVPGGSCGLWFGVRERVALKGHCGDGVILFNSATCLGADKLSGWGGSPLGQSWRRCLQIGLERVLVSFLCLTDAACEPRRAGQA